MKVILTDKVSSLGNIGEVVNVSPGFARNFLIPNRKAVIADEGNQKQMKHYQKALGKKVAEEKQEAVEIKTKLDGMTLEFIKRVAGSGKIFGTVTNAEISAELKKQGLEVERRTISLDTPIKALGSFTAKAKLFPEVVAEFNIKVDIDPKQAEELKKKEAEAAEMKKKAAERKAAEAEASDGSEEDVPKELTEEQKLAKEADALLRN